MLQDTGANLHHWKAKTDCLFKFCPLTDLVAEEGTQRLLEQRRQGIIGPVESWEPLSF